MSASRRRVTQVIVGFLALFLVGTVIVLSSVSYYLAIDPSAYLSELEVPVLDKNARLNVSSHERIPRIIHQTWKTETLPQRWQPVSKSCTDLMPDYEYMLWTDESARQFIADNYSWFLDTYDDYTYNIQRADAIRYFVLHHYGGIYIDLDIGCRRALDPLLVYPVILPKTIPVGVSNDLMFAEKGHPFLAQTIHNLATFDHNWIINYPTVMFSTGPMFLSAQYAIYTSSHPGAVRILPKSLYGKNAKEEEAPHRFFSHYYGSSWHDGDASFIAFLGTKGKTLMWIGLVIVILGLVRLSWPNGKQRRFRRHDIFFPRWSSRSGGWHIQLGSWHSDSSSSPPSPDPSTEPSSPVQGHVPVIHLPFGVRSSSPTPSDAAVYDSHSSSAANSWYDGYQRLRDRVSKMVTSTTDDVRTSSRSRRSSRGILFFLPAIFTTHPPDVEMGTRSSRPPPSTPSSQYPPEKQRYARDFERAGLTHLLDDGDMPSQSSTAVHSRDSSFSERQHLIDPSDTRLATPPRSRSVSRSSEP